MSAVNEKISQLIKDARKAGGLTQKQLGEKVGVSESMINKYEKGKSQPTVEMLYRITEAVGQDLILAIDKKQS